MEEEGGKEKRDQRKETETGKELGICIWRWRKAEPQGIQGLRNLYSRPWRWQGKCFPRMSKTLTEPAAPEEREGVTWGAGV